ncbi:MAG: PHB depolymerase family esterase [Pseudomonas sp.]
MKLLLRLLLALLAIAASLYAYFVYAPKPAQPTLGATLQSDHIQVGALQRHYSYYIPKNLPANAPLVFVLHGSLQTREDIRAYTGYEFERLADAHGFAVVYPQGFENNWNDCRKVADYAARKQNIDDKGFISALIKRFAEQQHTDSHRVFLTGYSSGAQLGFRLALENPGLLAGIGAVAANLPTLDNLACQPSDKAVSMLVINGTDDPINPYRGGVVTLFGLGNRGMVRSAQDTALYFAGLAGYDKPSLNAPTETANVHLQQWQAQGQHEVALYSLLGGGHVVPQPLFRAPRMLGANVPGFNAPQTIWAFFARQPAQP